MKFKDKLKRIHACAETVEWVGDRSEKKAWKECERADWLAWYAFCAKKGTHEQRVEAICQIVEVVLPRVEDFLPGDDRPRKAVETARLAARLRLLEERVKAGRASQHANAASLEAKLYWDNMKYSQARLAEYAAEAARVVALIASEKPGVDDKWAAWSAVSSAIRAVTKKKSRNLKIHKKFCDIIQKCIPLKESEGSGL